MINYGEKTKELIEKGNYYDELSKVYTGEGRPFDLNEEAVEELWRLASSDAADEELVSFGCLASFGKGADIKSARTPFPGQKYGWFKNDPEAIFRNPATVKELASELRSLTKSELYALLGKDVPGARTGGHFCKFLLTLEGIPVVTPEEMKTKYDAVYMLDPRSNAKMLKFCNNYLGMKLKKAPDAVFSIFGVYLVLEAKHVTDKGGAQNLSIMDIFHLLDQERPNVITVGILDGVGVANLCSERIFSSLFLQPYLSELCKEILSGEYKRKVA